MLEKIICFNNTISRYEVLPYFTTGLMKALKRLKIDCEIIVPEKGNIFPFLQKIYQDPPDCTLCFNGLLYDSNERFLADMIEIPHVACLVDNINWFFSLIKSPYYIITCPDKTSCALLNSLQFKKWIYMPHGVDASLKMSEEGEKREYDVAFFGTCIDFKSIQDNWRASYSKQMIEILEKAAEETLSNPSVAYQEALMTGLQKASIDVEQSDAYILFSELDQYVRGRDRYELIKSIKYTPVHVFGGALGELSWQEQLKGCENVIFHDPIPYPEVIKKMKQSKIVLNSSPMFKFGGHERIFTALACGALTLTNETAYMLENFQNNQNVALYQPMHWDAIDDQVHSILKDEEKRKQIALNGRNEVLSHHTWDHRARDLVRDLQPLLASFEKS